MIDIPGDRVIVSFLRERLKGATILNSLEFLGTWVEPAVLLPARVGLSPQLRRIPEVGERICDPRLIRIRVRNVDEERPAAVVGVAADIPSPQLLCDYRFQVIFKSRQRVELFVRRESVLARRV